MMPSKKYSIFVVKLYHEKKNWLGELDGAFHSKNSQNPLGFWEPKQQRGLPLDALALLCLGAGEDELLHRGGGQPGHHALRRELPGARAGTGRAEDVAEDAGNVWRGVGGFFLGKGTFLFLGNKG